MATNAGHQAAWRARQQQKFAAAEEELQRLRKEVGLHKEAAVPPEVEAVATSEEVMALRNELAVVKEKNTALRRKLRQLMAIQRYYCALCGGLQPLPPLSSSSPHQDIDIDYDWLTRFVKVASYIQSDNEHERHSAADRVKKMLFDARLSMGQVLGDDAIPKKRQTKHV